MESLRGLPDAHLPAEMRVVLIQQLLEQKGFVRVRDLASKNGVWVGERRVTERLLGDRDEVRVGSTVVRFEDPAAAQVAGTRW